MTATRSKVELNPGETLVEGFAHCKDNSCVGYQQQKVQVARFVKSESFIDAGGDGTFSGEYRSPEYLRFADQSDYDCPFCELPREVTLQERPDYGTSSQPKPQGEQAVDGKMAALVASQAAAIARLEAKIGHSIEDVD